MRFYYASNGNGNSMTFEIESGVTITNVVINASSSSYTPTVKYSVNNGSATSISASGTTYTISGISATSSLKIQNGNTTNTQLRFTSIQITYTTGGSGGGEGGGGGGTGDYVLVTSSQDDWSGDYVMTYVSGSTAYVLTGLSPDGNFGAYTTATISNNTLTNSAVGSYNIEIARVTYNNNTCYTLKIGDSYLGYTSTSTSGNNNLYFATSIPSSNPHKYYWTISYSSNNILTIKSVYNTSRYIKYNSGSPRFACYTSGQKDISLFKKNDGPATFDITASANPAAGGTVSGAGSYESGQNCTLTATANTGYTFTNWTKGGTVVSSSASYTFEVTEAGAYVANFTPNSYTISATANPTNGGTITGAGSHNYNSTCTLRATANTGYTFVNWTENGSVVSTNATFNFTVTGNRTLVANFTTSYTISASANPSAGGSITGAGTFASGASCTLRATAASGYTFTNWTENGQQVSDNANYTFTVNANRTLVANFTLNSYSIGASASPAAGGSVSGAGTYNHGASCTLTATPNTGYVFTRWTKNGTQVSTNATYTFNVTGAADYVAVFTPTYTINATANPSEGGSISGTGTYNDGTSCTLTATAATNYRFDNWTENGSVVSTNANYTFTVNANRTLVANFTRTYAITASTNPNGAGSISGAGNYASGESCTLAVTPAAGYTFTNWTKNGVEVSTDLSFTFSVTEAAAYVANFTTNSYSVSVSAHPSAGGTVSQSGNGTYNHGASCTVTATPNTAYNYSFLNWTENGTVVSSSASYTFSVTANRDLVANFGIPCDYVKVTASQDDWSGDYVIAYDNGVTARVLSGKASGGDFGDYVTPNQTDHTLASADVSSYNIVIEKVGSNNYYTLKQGNYYLYYTGSSNNLYFGTAIGDTPNEYYWTITYSGTTMTIANVNSSGRKIRWNNSSSKRFACYLDSSNQQEISLYKKDVCGPTCPVPTNLAVVNNSITANSASISWTGDAESYNVRYRTYEAGEATTLTEDFSDYTPHNYSETTNISRPSDWAYQAGTTSYIPQVSSNNALSSNYNISGMSNQGNFFYMCNKNNYAVMPRYESISSVSFKYAFENANNGTFRVGYVTNTSNISSSFTAFTDVNTSGTTTLTTVTLTNDDINTLNNTTGARLAFNFNYDGLYGFGIDDIVITCQSINAGQWQPNENGASATSPYTLNNLATATTYEVQVQSVCEEGFESDWSDGITFTTLSGYTITATADPVEGGSVSGGGTYNPNASCTLTAEANTGYTFTNWTKDGVVVWTNPTYTFTVTESGAYVANFTINSYTVNVTAGANGSATQSGNGTYDHGDNCTITATAATGYHFVNWTEDGSLVSTENPYTFEVEDDRNLVANFAINSYAVTIEANPSNGGTLTGSASGDYNHGATVSVTATASTGYHFVNWTVDGDEVSTSATLSNYAITSECTILANFAINSYAVTIEATEGGSISGSTSGNYNHGATVNVTATATTGYHFVNWTVDDVEESTSTALTYTISGACTIRANFEPDTFVISASVASENSGSVTGAGTYNYNETCTLTATANEGYTFVNWTKNNVIVSSSASYSFTVTTDASYVANFQRNTYRITVAAVPSIGGNVSGAGNFNHGVSVTVNATANPGYQFVSWTRGSADGQVMSSTASYTFTATEAIDLVANFLYVVEQPTVTTNSQVTNITGSSAQCSGEITSTGNGTISAYGFCWNTTGNPTTQDEHNQVGFSTSEPFSFNITGLNANTLYYVRAYATNQEGTAYGNQVTFATKARVTTASVTAHTLDAIMGGSWVSGSGDETVSDCGVEYKEATASTWQTASMSVPESGTSFSGTVSGLTANTSYVVRAYVTNGGGTSYGAERTFSTIGYFAVSATVDPAESGTVTFSPAGTQTATIHTAQIGSGTSVNQAWFPVNTYNMYSFDEMIYPGGGDMVAGNITKIAFHYKASGSTNMSLNLDIYLKNVDNAMVFTGQPISVTDATLCFSSTITLSSNTDQWVEIEFTTPFEYTGNGNILVAVNNKTGDASVRRNWYATETNALTCYSYRGGPSQTTPLDPTALSGGSALSDANSTKRPNIRFTIVDSNSDTHLYPWGENVTLTATPATGYEFLNWTENSVVVSTANPYTLTSIQADHALVANFINSKTFTNAYGDHDWNNGANWEPAGVPNGINVVIAADATISSGIEGYVNNISISTGSITIEDGGQLKHNNNGVVVTTEKSITGYGHENYETNKGYYLISSPVNGISYSNVSGLVTTEYDLYSFESDHTESNGDLTEWVVVNGNLVANKGYLYASETTTTLAVTGTVAHSATPIVETLTYNSGYRFGGWNLVGNPFVCDAYVTSSSNEMNYYVLNHTADYDEFITASSSDPIAPMEGLMVQATAANQTVTFSRIEPSKGSGILNMDVHKTSVRGIATLDRARVRFGEGTNLEKFQFNPRHTKISIPEGSNEYSVYYADGAGTIPVNFKAEDNGRYTLDFSTEEIGFNYLHLIDNMNGNDVDLLQTPYYAFDAKSTDFASRFLLVFATGNDNGETFAFFNNGLWIINNDGEATLQVVDALGRILSSENITGSCSKAINAAPGVYMLRLINGDNVKVQKVVVKR